MLKNYLGVFVWVAVMLLLVGCDDNGDEKDIEEGESAIPDSFSVSEVQSRLESIKPASEELPKPLRYTFTHSGPHIDEEYVYGVYQDAGLTLVTHHHRDREPDFLEPEAPHLFWLSGEPVDGHLTVRRGDTLIVSLLPSVEVGEEHEDIMGRGYLDKIEKLDVELSPGESTREFDERTAHEYVLEASYEMRRNDEDGEEVYRDESTYRGVLWIDEELPYSPTFAAPLVLGGTFFASPTETQVPLQGLIYDRIGDELRRAGLVLGVEIYRADADEPFVELQASEIHTVEPLHFEF